MIFWLIGLKVQVLVLVAWYEFQRRDHVAAIRGLIRWLQQTESGVRHDRVTNALLLEATRDRAKPKAVS